MPDEEPLMKCPKTVPAMMMNGETKRPERPCSDTMSQLEPNLWSCPMHGLVEVDGTLHTVVPGDTLSALAKRYYGSPHLWRFIYDANCEQIDARAREAGKTERFADWIYPGQVFVVPVIAVADNLAEEQSRLVAEAVEMAKTNGKPKKGWFRRG